MYRFLIPCVLAAALAACHPNHPWRTGLYAGARTIVPASLERVGTCLAARLPPTARRRTAPDGSWRQLSDGAAGAGTWELRLTRLDATRTEVEIDTSPALAASGDAMARLAAACAEG